MRTYRVSHTAHIHAPAAVAYGIIADYRDGHPHILPPQFFRNLTVQEGGIGAGSHIRFEMGAFGQWRIAEAVVSEPEPGRLLQEDIPAQQIRTTFLVEPAGMAACAVTITTDFPLRDGVVGTLERLTTSAVTRRVYRAELALLDQVSRRRAALD